MSLLVTALFLPVAVTGAGVALTRDPRRQVMAIAGNGLALTLLFLSLQAPDVDSRSSRWAPQPCLCRFWPRWPASAQMRSNKQTKASNEPAAPFAGQLEELDRLIEPWLDDYERTSRAARN